ncbi:MAG: XTP/dITP diphosphatase [Pseudomonadales bacterium]|uniref:dITP/XTP pyrophosphatase n=1 Tax=Oleiphilus messinensis TaxID=141451 RepID=A0A1Y0I3P1_9GAMM|nr:XTP/dITP diphosphatase [Oleiphilus messinensis]ARU55031.1 non-canonical purine NTP pyrophosphatase, rdgB/HAM1 family [Oleiphilus messinensis]MCG8610861.1 XTP/dITP diphosphatase [Pseudomonadales bacterium]
MTRVVIASSNKGKLNEFNIMLNALDIQVLPQADFDIPEVEETGQSFVENAILKARNACKYSGLPALADDSGLVVDALQGNPGIFSARYAGPNATDQDNIEKLMSALQSVPEEGRSARFHCALVFMLHEKDPTPLVCQGNWEGRIHTRITGNGGFGYDPVFWVEELNCTAAELSAEAKNERSHRGLALKQLKQQIQDKLNRQLDSHDIAG